MQLPDVQQWLLYMLAALAVWWVVSRIRKRRAAKRAAQRRAAAHPRQSTQRQPRGANRRPCRGGHRIPRRLHRRRVRCRRAVPPCRQEPVQMRGPLRGGAARAACGRISSRAARMTSSAISPACRR